MPRYIPSPHHTGVQSKLLPSVRGKITAAQVADSFNADDIHYPPSRLVSLENTANQGGGSFYTLEEMQSISSVCRAAGVSLHLDGARIFNAALAAGFEPSILGLIFDSVSICLSKGLGCPVGSILLGSLPFIKRARRFRKAFGGGMRQAGFLAAAGIYALEHNVKRLEEDHVRAKQLGEVLKGCQDVVEEVYPIDTNIVLVRLKLGFKVEKSIEILNRHGILASDMGHKYLRFVTHLHITDEDIETAAKAIVASLAELARAE